MFLFLMAQAIGASPAAKAPPPDEPTSIGTGARDQSEIVVTARRKRETAQTVPLAISVVGGDHIDATGAFNVGRLQQLTPTLQFYSSNPRNTAVNIRGIGVPFGLTNDGIEQGVGIYVDDVYFSRVASSTFDFLDVERIEVLRGPQGTLYGKNTSAGAINITSRQPEFKWGGRAEASIGNLGFYQLKGALTGPISSTLAFRVAFSRTERNGTILNVRTGDKVNNQDNLGTRAQLLWKPSNDFQLTLAGDYNRQNPDCCVQIYVRTGLTQRPIARQYDALAAAFGYAVPSTNPFDRLTDQDTPSHAGNKTGGLSARAKIETGIGTITSITAWRFWDWDPSSDRDFLGLPITTASQNPSKQNQYTQELRFNHSGKAFDLSLGAFAFRQTIRTNGLQIQGTAASRWLLNPGNVPVGSSACIPTTANACKPSVLDGLTATNKIGLDNDSAALFGQLAWKVTDKLTLQPGVRLNYDLKNGHYSSVVTDKAGNLVVFGPTDSVTRDRLSVLTPQQFDARYKAWNLSYDFTANYRPTRAIMAYATYARSFKSGGINLNGVPNDAAGNPLLAAATVKPEKIDHLEAGLKTQWDRGRVTANLALFRTDIRNFQALVNNGQLGVLRGYLANAQKVRSQGAEWDLSWRPSRHFSAYLNGAYTDARYRRFVDAPCPPELSGGTTVTGSQVPGAAGTPGALSPASCDISGQVLPGVSHWSLSYGGEISQPIRIGGGEAEIYVGGDANTRSRFSSNPSPSAYTWIKGYTLANFRVGVRRKALDGFLWVRNAFDTHYFEQLAVASGNTGLIVGQPGDERTFGATIKTVF